MGQILNEQQFKSTLNKANELEKAIKDSEKKLKLKKMSKKDIELINSPLKSFLYDLKYEIKEYKELKKGKIPKELLSLNNIGKLLIALRISKGLTQKELALKLGTKQSHVSRNEVNEYHGISLSNMKKVLKALDSEIKLTISN